MKLGGVCVFRAVLSVAFQKAYPFVCLHKLSHDSKHEWGLAMTHAPLCDRFWRAH